MFDSLRPRALGACRCTEKVRLEDASGRSDPAAGNGTGWQLWWLAWCYLDQVAADARAGDTSPVGELCDRHAAVRRILWALRFKLPTGRRKLRGDRLRCAPVDGSPVRRPVEIEDAQASPGQSRNAALGECGGDRSELVER
jgi:hypothetical protein